MQNARIRAEVVISIHAPREGGDDGVIEREQQERLISIHAPREGGDCQVLPPIAMA